MIYYQIVSAKKSALLTDAVNSLILTGWKPLGGAYFANSHHRQTMILGGDECECCDDGTLEQLAKMFALLPAGSVERHECSETIRAVLAGIRSRT